MSRRATAVSRSPGSRWRPLLSGEPAARARRVVSEIAEALADAGPATDTDDSLNDGSAGLALLWGYLALVEPGRDHDVRAGELLAGAYGRIAAGRMSAGLFDGFPGTAWVIEHLRGRCFEADEDDPNATLDRLLEDGLRLAAEHHPLPFDLFSGLVGQGLYALERLPDPGARRLLELVVRRLDGQARSGGGFGWWTFVPQAIPATPDAGLFEEGSWCQNLGVAHGLTGVIGLLGQVADLDPPVAGARELLGHAVESLLAHRPAGFPEEEYPSWAGREHPPAPRTAWCHGNPGMAAALWVAARCAGEPAWERAAIEMALAAAERDPSRARVEDAALCHGSAGVAHLFNRLYQAADETRLAEAARFWLERALEHRQPGSGIAGFRKWEGHWVDRTGFVHGAAGIALALLAATTSVAPAWDRLLLASPVRS